MTNKQLALWQMTNGCCYYCGRKLITPTMSGYDAYAPNEFTIDHLTPRCKGGTSTPDNLAPACRQCNVIKRGKTVEEYREYLAWLRIGVDRFTDSQIDWLLENGIEPPQPPPYTFYFEEMEGDL